MSVRGIRVACEEFVCIFYSYVVRLIVRPRKRGRTLPSRVHRDSKIWQRARTPFAENFSRSSHYLGYLYPYRYTPESKDREVPEIFEPRCNLNHRMYKLSITFEFSIPLLTNFFRYRFAQTFSLALENLLTIPRYICFAIISHVPMQSLFITFDL